MPSWEQDSKLLIPESVLQRTANWKLRQFMRALLGCCRQKALPRLLGSCTLH